MGQQGDDRLALPDPPPPNPAARREAIDAAVRRFDGLDPLPAPRPRFSLAGWASAHRAAAGGLVTAALVAVVAIPAIQVAIGDRPPEVTSEDSLSERAPVGVRDVEDSVAADPPLPTQDQAPAAAKPPVPEVAANPADIAEYRSNFVAPEREEKAKLAAPAPLAAAPAPMIAPAPAPPPPPPPPPPSAAEAQGQAAADSDQLIVTGSRIRQPQLERQRGAPRGALSSASPIAVVDPFGEYLSRLQAAFHANDRRALLRLTGYPLRVQFGGDVRTYRTARDVERDYDRIFTPRVRAAALDTRSDELLPRDGGRLRGNGSIWFGCGLRSCSSADTVKIRQITP